MRHDAFAYPSLRSMQHLTLSGWLQNGHVKTLSSFGAFFGCAASSTSSSPSTTMAGDELG
jgi:hypothetical protein